MEHTVRRLVGLPGDRLLRAHLALRRPDEFRVLVDRCTRPGIGVILDWVPAHFPKRRLRARALRRHRALRARRSAPRRAPRLGHARLQLRPHEVAQLPARERALLAREFHADGIRVDAVASMLYLDYSRKAGRVGAERVRRQRGPGRVSFLQRAERVAYGREPGYRRCGRGVDRLAGRVAADLRRRLGFGFKWNMGWMHDTLEYFQRDPIHRRYHHHQLTFGLLYAFSENFVLPLSHDEVVHGKGSLLTKMPGDDWQKFANLRALYGLQWAHPARKLLFMGCEFAQRAEWNGRVPRLATSSSTHPTQGCSS
jgi:1,4-alpha-glucan branching enzyme